MRSCSCGWFRPFFLTFTDSDSDQSALIMDYWWRVKTDETFKNSHMVRFLQFTHLNIHRGKTKTTWTWSSVSVSLCPSCISVKFRFCLLTHQLLPSTAPPRHHPTLRLQPHTLSHHHHHHHHHLLLLLLLHVVTSCLQTARRTRFPEGLSQCVFIPLSFTCGPWTHHRPGGGGSSSSVLHGLSSLSWRSWSTLLSGFLMWWRRLLVTAPYYRLWRHGLISSADRHQM